VVRAGTTFVASIAGAAISAASMPWQATFVLGLVFAVIVTLDQRDRRRKGEKALEKALQRKDLTHVAEVIRAAFGVGPRRGPRSPRE
jgi:hypothetical protein